MRVLSFTDTRARLRAVMDGVVRDSTPVVVTRQRGEAVVMVSLSDWQAMEETLHLLSTRANADQLLGAVAEFDAGRGVERDLAEL